MARLLLLRHAKSDWGAGIKGDAERPLSPRGRDAADRMGKWLAGAGLEPDLVLCSPSRRTRETLARLGRVAGIPEAVRFLDALYEDPAAPREDYIGIIRAEAAEAGLCLVIGHNPMTSNTAVALAGKGASDALARMRTKFPTGALAILDFPGSLGEAEPGSGALADFVCPRDLA